MCLITRPDKRPLLLETSSGRPFVLASSKFRTRPTKELWVPSFYMIWHPPLWDSFICHDTQKRGRIVIFKICQKEKNTIRDGGSTATKAAYNGESWRYCCYFLWKFVFLETVVEDKLSWKYSAISAGELPPLLSPRAVFFQGMCHTFVAPI